MGYYVKFSEEIYDYLERTRQDLSKLHKKDMSYDDVVKDWYKLLSGDEWHG